MSENSLVKIAAIIFSCLCVFLFLSVVFKNHELAIKQELQKQQEQQEQQEQYRKNTILLNTKVKPGVVDYVYYSIPEDAKIAAVQAFSKKKEKDSIFLSLECTIEPDCQTNVCTYHLFFSEINRNVFWKISFPFRFCRVKYSTPAENKNDVILKVFLLSK